MYRRCHNVNHPRYKDYGEKGVVVCDKWKNFNGFVEDIDKIEGFDLSQLLAGKIHLDKDKKTKGNKIYCLEECIFITKEENNKIKPNQQREIEAISPEGEVFTFLNQSEFARKYGLRQSCIGDCLRGKCKTHKKWKFRYL